ncbi:MAG: hypothetical protein AAGF86_01845 [Pseudomonadota bacterium]
MIAFAVRFGAPAGWSSLSGRLYVKTTSAKFINNARTFCFGADVTLKADLNVRLTLGSEPELASGNNELLIYGEWVWNLESMSVVMPLGTAPDEVRRLVQRFGRDRVWLQILNAYCPDDGTGDPEICFQALLKPEPSRALLPARAFKAQ